MQGAKELVKHSSFNFVVKLLAQLFNLALIPLYVHYLTQHDYGILNIAYVFLNFFLIVAILGQNESLTRYFNKVKNVRLKGLIFSNILMVSLLFALLLFGLSTLLMAEISGALFNDSSHTLLLILTLFTGVLEVAGLVIVMLMHAQQNSVLYGKTILGKNILKFTFTFIFFNYFNLGLIGAMLALNIGSLFLVWGSYSIIKKWWVPHFSLRIVKHVVPYGLPFVVNGLAASFLFQADQVIIKFMVGLPAVGVYGLGYKLGSAIQYINSSFSLAWFPYLYKTKKGAQKERILNATEVYLVLIVLLGVVLTTANNLFLGYFLPAAYLQVIHIIPWIIWGYIIYGLIDFFGAGLYLKYKSRLISYISSFAAILNIILNILLIPVWGIEAAAVITFISFLIMVISAYIFSQHYFPLHFPLIRYAKSALPLVVIFILSFVRFSQSCAYQILQGTLLIAMALLLTAWFNRDIIIKLKRNF